MVAAVPKTSGALSEGSSPCRNPSGNTTGRFRKAALESAPTLAMNVRAIAKGEVGARNEKLVEFGVAPLRPRKKRKPQQGPDELDPAAGKSQLST